MLLSFQLITRNSSLLFYHIISAVSSFKDLFKYTLGESFLGSSGLMLLEGKNDKQTRTCFIITVLKEILRRDYLSPGMTYL